MTLRPAAAARASVIRPVLVCRPRLFRETLGEGLHGGGLSKRLPNGRSEPARAGQASSVLYDLSAMLSVLPSASAGGWTPWLMFVGASCCDPKKCAPDESGAKKMRSYSGGWEGGVHPVWIATMRD